MNGLTPYQKILIADSGTGSVRVVVARRAVSLLSNRTFGAWITRTRNSCCGTISRSWTKNTLIGFCSSECPLGVVRCDGTPQNPTFSRRKGSEGYHDNIADFLGYSTEYSNSISAKWSVYPNIVENPACDHNGVKA